MLPKCHQTLIAGLVLTTILTTLSGCAQKPVQNVLVITIDTLRADRLGAYGFALARTPNIDRLAKEGVLFENAIATAPITLPSHSTIFTGLLPPAHGVRDNGSYALGDEAVTLAERFKAEGAETQAFVSAVVLNRRYNLDQGFDAYDDDLWAEDEPQLFMIRSRSAPKTAERATRWLNAWGKRGREKPFFVWVHFFDPHQPNNLPMAQRIGSPTPYDAEIAIADQGVGMLIQQLEKLGVLDETLIVLTADHGESLGEHGEKTHAVFIYDATMRVPLILRSPRQLPRGKVYRGPVRSQDIAPTILSAFKMPGAEETQGVDLAPLVRGEKAAPDLPQYSESLASEVGFGMAPLYGVRKDGWKWIRAPRPEVYDLKKDPRELKNLFATEARRGSQLDRELEKILDDSARHAIVSPENPLDQETEENLRALGYLAPRSERTAMAGIDPKDGMVLYQKLEDARHEAQNNRWPEAERMVREILEKTPRNVTCLNILALARLRQSDNAGARDAYFRSLGVDPQQARIFSMLGTISMLEGDWDRAEKEFHQALGISDTFVEAMSNLGLIASLRGDRDKALEWNEKALALDPTFPRAYRRLADLAYERGDWARALANYKKVIKIARSDFASLIQAGNSARRLNRGKEAETFLRKAARLRPDSWVPTYNLACLFAVRGQTAPALVELAKLANEGFHRSDLLANDPDLAAVRTDPGFSALRERVRVNATNAAKNDVSDDASVELSTH